MLTEKNTNSLDKVRFDKCIKTVSCKFQSCKQKQHTGIKIIARECHHQKELAIKQVAIKEVRDLYVSGCSNDEIARKTGHISRTVKNILMVDVPYAMTIMMIVVQENLLSMKKKLWNLGHRDYLYQNP